MSFSSEFPSGGRVDIKRSDRVDRTGRAQPAALRLNAATKRVVFSLEAAVSDAIVVFGAALVAGTVYRQGTDPHDTVTSGLIVTALFLLTNALRRDYAIPHYLKLKGHAGRVLITWIVAFGMALALAFMTKTTSIYSRGAIAIFFLLGFPAVMLARNILVRHMRRKAEAGEIVSRTILLVGPETEILSFMARHRPSRCGLKVVGAPVLRDEPGTLDEDLALAVAMARMLLPDDVFLLVPWTDPDLISNCVDRFRRLPAAIHLGPTLFLDRLDDLRIARAGAISSIHLVRSPLSAMEIAAKRLFDLIAAVALLLMLSPVLVLAALAIKLDSRGPVFFLQRRYGFNQEPFRIVKFRSMSTLEDDATLRQVTSGDPRLTRVGRLLRRTSIDELPQLWNVLKGDMSLVGPRPHALVHDQQFEPTVALYARRHNVRPGITGWAQVNGFRGETDTPQKVQGRIEHDLHYIDNWSVWFDVAILLRTVFSTRSYRNAR